MGGNAGEVRARRFHRPLRSDEGIPARQNSHLAWAITERVHISVKDKSGRGKVTGLRGFGDFVFKHVTGQNMACL
jgi:hypothetical protein